MCTLYFGVYIWTSVLAALYMFACMFVRVSSSASLVILLNVIWKKKLLHFFLACCCIAPILFFSSELGFGIFRCKTLTLVLVDQGVSIVWFLTYSKTVKWNLIKLEQKNLQHILHFKFYFSFEWVLGCFIWLYGSGAKISPSQLCSWFFSSTMRLFICFPFFDTVQGKL